MSWRRGQSYSEHLRDRVLAAVDGGLGANPAAKVFQVSVSWIYKARARRRSTGETTARAQCNHVPPRLAPQYEAIRAKVAAEPDLTLMELREWVKREHQVSISHGGMHKTLARLKLTRKKRPSTPLNKSAPTLPRREPSGERTSRS